MERAEDETGLLPASFKRLLLVAAQRAHREQAQRRPRDKDRTAGNIECAIAIVRDLVDWAEADARHG
jgi:hypothetical protein